MGSVLVVALVLTAQCVGVAQATVRSSVSPKTALVHSSALRVTNIIATAGDASATVSWSAPKNLGTKPVLKYTVQAYYKSPTTQQRTVKSTVTTAGTNTSVVVPDLSNGMAYDFTITAENAVAWFAVNTNIMVRPSGLPCKPNGINVTVGKRKATVKWQRPCNGGATATFSVALYASGQVVATRSNIWDNHTFPSTTFTGLTNGIQYTAVVTSTNRNGSVTSDPSTQFSPNK